MKKLIVKNLTQKYTYAVEGISKFCFECNIGEIAVILGGQESGKTSLLRCLAGLNPIAEGEIYIDGILANEFSVKKRNIALTYDDYCFLKNKSVRKNLLYPLEIRKTDKDTANKTVDDALARFNIENIASKKISELSDEEKICIVFARLSLIPRDIYLFDNPFNNFSDNVRKMIFQKYLPLIKDLSKNAAVIYATNDSCEAAFFGNNITLLNYGITLQKGSYDTIKHCPYSITALKLLNEDIKLIYTKLEKDNNKIFVNINGEIKYLSEQKLINDIFVNKEITVAVLDNNIKLFDARSEQLIYFD